MKKKYLIGIVFGIIAGIIDVTPMIIQNLSWDANISAFIMWIVVGFLISSLDLKIKPIFKGMFTAFLVLSTSIFLIAWNDAKVLIPISIMTIFLSSLLGFFIDKYSKNI